MPESHVVRIVIVTIVVGRMITVPVPLRHPHARLHHLNRPAVALRLLVNASPAAKVARRLNAVNLKSSGM